MPESRDDRLRLSGVKRIAVLRGGGIGDVLLALPAIQSLAAAYPEAELTLLSRRTPGQLLVGRTPFPLSIVELPKAPGVEDGPDAAHVALDHWFGALTARPFDLAVQLHGGGRHSNPFVQRLAARHSVGLATPDAVHLERTLPYLYYQHETMRYLETVGLVGAAAVALEPELGPLEGDLAAARALVPEGAGPLVVLHTGATDPRRHWPIERFQALASGLEEQGARVVRLRADLTAAQLVGLLARADLLVGNDSGPRHLAGALGTPTVGIYWAGNVINAGPLGRGRNRVRISWTTRCPICGIDVTQVGWTAERCEHEVSMVADVQVEDILADALDLLSSAAQAPR